MTWLWQNANTLATIAMGIAAVAALIYAHLQISEGRKAEHLLNASEEILHVLPTKEWDAAVRIQLKQHRDYLLSSHFRKSGYLDQYTPSFRAFMDEALRETPKRHA